MLRPLMLILGLALALATPVPAQTTTPDSTTAAPETGGKTGFAIITPKGYVSLSADDSWKLTAIQTKMPVAVLAFVVPDSAAGDSRDDVTNLSVTLSDPSTPEGKQAFAIYGVGVGDQVPVRETYKTWTVYSQTATYSGADYTVIDAVSHIADVDVGARLSYPHLAGHPDGYDATMRTLFLAELDDIGGDFGAFPMPAGATAYRPTGQ